MSSQKDYSMATADIVDGEVRDLHKLAQLLIEKETVDGEEFMSLFIDGKAELYVG